MLQVGILFVLFAITFDMSKFPCNSCDFNTRHFAFLLRHYRVTHSFQHGFWLSCGIDQCQKTFSVIDSYTRHIKNKHRYFYEMNMSTRFVAFRHVTTENDSTSEHTDLNMDLSPSEPEENRNNQTDNGVDQELEFQDHDYKKDIALFILSLREMKKLPVNTCPDIVAEIQDLFLSCKTETLLRLHSVLTRNQIDIEQIDGLHDIFNGFAAVESSCQSLSSVFKQNRFFNQNFDFIEPVEIILGRRGNNNPETSVYVPIIDTLKTLLKHDDVLAEVLNGHSNVSGLLGDFCDGKIFKNHPLFSEDCRNLQIQLYADEFQVVNPLGTKVKKYKIMAVYFVLGNLKPKQKSKLHSVQLALLCPAYLVKKFGWDVVLKPLITDVMALETEGILVQFEESTLLLRGTISMVVCDNLAAHSLSGLTESFSALRNCRFCNVTREIMQTEFVASNLTLRMPSAYNQQIDIVKQNPDLASVYGVKESSPLNKLKYFHAIGNMPSDIAHDIFEGFGSDVMQIVVVQLVKDGFFTLQDLNEKIRTFPYQQSDKINKPSIMAEELSKFKIKQTASQTWCLMRLLPLMIGQDVPEGNVHLSLLTKFLDIVDLTCAPVLAEGDAAYVGELVEQFLSLFFGNIENLDIHLAVKPKAHYLVHYAYEILQFGPLKHCWTLRFEGKHNYFKEVSHSTKNKKNICKTLATRHQYMQCLHYASENYLESDVTSTRKGSAIPVCLLKENVQNLLHDVLGDQEMVYQVSSATFEGTVFSSGGIVVLDFDEDLYQFGKIDCIFDLGGSLHLLLRCLHTMEFSTHFHAYVIEETDRCVLSQPRNLLDHYPLGLYTIGVDKMVVLKHRVVLP